MGGSAMLHLAASAGSQRVLRRQEVQAEEVVVAGGCLHSPASKARLAPALSAAGGQVQGWRPAEVPAPHWPLCWAGQSHAWQQAAEQGQVGAVEAEQIGHSGSRLQLANQSQGLPLPPVTQAASLVTSH